MSTILAADTSTRFCTVALWRDTGLVAEHTLVRERLHSEGLIAMIDALLATAETTLAAVDLLAISKGPGSFTGLRVGVATFKGLALGADKPLLGVPTLDAFARLAPVGDAPVYALIDARMDEVFGAGYTRAGGRLVKTHADYVGPVETLLAKATDTPYILGDGAAPYAARILAVQPNTCFAPPELNHPRAAAVAAEAEALLAAGAPADGARVEPVYLRKSQAEQARDAKRAATAAS